MSTGEQIVETLTNDGGFTSLLSCSDMAVRAGVAESTVRRWLPRMIATGRVRHTSYSGLYSVMPQPPQNL